MLLGSLICISDIAFGRELAGKEEISLAHGEGTSKIGCSTGDKTCGEGHEYNRKESLKEYIGGTFVNNKSSFTNSRNNANDNNANRNNLGNHSGNGNVVRGNVSQDGNQTVNGAGSGNAVVSAIGQNAGKGVNTFNYNEGSPAPRGSKSSSSIATNKT
ncbi:hypothetical protein LXL04_037389 [Taraxacum kok-saghyz]